MTNTQEVALGQGRADGIRGDNDEGYSRHSRGIAEAAEKGISHRSTPPTPLRAAPAQLLRPPAHAPSAPRASSRAPQQPPTLARPASASRRGRGSSQRALPAKRHAHAGGARGEGKVWDRTCKRKGRKRTNWIRQAYWVLRHTWAREDNRPLHMSKQAARLPNKSSSDSA
eukprot:356588-Chlamydomonas_euryale.AAC.1